MVYVTAEVLSAFQTSNSGEKTGLYAGTFAGKGQTKGGCDTSVHIIDERNFGLLTCDQLYPLTPEDKGVSEERI